jgi:hypothetical protein
MSTAATATTSTVETARIIALLLRGYLEKRPRPKKPRMANTTMTMMMIQRIDTWSLRRGFAESIFPVGSSLQLPLGAPRATFRRGYAFGLSPNNLRILALLLQVQVDSE